MHSKGGEQSDLIICNLDKPPSSRDFPASIGCAQSEGAKEALSISLKSSMIQMYLSGPELLFVAADATWRCEAAKVLNCKSNDLGLILLPEAHGEPDTLLRTAFEVRERAYAVWCQASETLSANDACPVIPSPNDRS